MNNGRYLAIFFVLFFTACKKDAPQDNPVSTTASFVPVVTGPDCSIISSTGTYVAGTALDTAANKVVIRVNVTRAGKYFINTSLENGFYFVDSGTMANTGLQNITLRGLGEPNAPGATILSLTSSGTTCTFTIQVAPNPGNTYDDNDHMYLGNPSNATSSINNPANYLMRKQYYALSYNRDAGIPNWVSWHLFSGDLGSVQRQDDFRPDNSLPAGWYKVPEFAYNNSGFDRGHNVPSADRTLSIDANSATFLMTNIIPQAPNHNQIAWARMEDSLRSLVGKGFELYIIMGVYGQGGSGSAGYATTVDAGRVVVPANIWKVALVLPNGNADSSRINTETRVIAVDIPNNNNVNSNWKTYRVSVDAIEAATGYNLFTRLPVALQAQLEAKVDDR